ncbi:MAG: RNA methyltransferase [Candidatus Falkowbacteria bacterium]
MEIISSEQNSKIKNIVKLQDKSRERKKQGLFVIDGLREIKEALKSGIIIEEIFVCPEIIKEELNIFSDIKTFSVSLSVYKKIGYKEKPAGVLAVARPKLLELASLKLKKNPLLVILEAVEKPGNLGAIVRSAYAAGVDAIIINDEQTDIYNPNVIRASEGLIFRLPVIVADHNSTKGFLEKENIKVYAAALVGAKNYTEANFKDSSAILLGTEATGLSAKWLEKADEIIKIPMKAGIDSLNVSVSAAILIFEAWKQRDFL